MSTPRPRGRDGLLAALDVDRECTASRVAGRTIRMAGVRMIVTVVRDPELFADIVAAKAPSGGASRLPTWGGPEFQKPQYQTTLFEVSF